MVSPIYNQSAQCADHVDHDPSLLTLLSKGFGAFEN